MTRMPSLFVSHGAPTLVIEDGPAARFLRQLGSGLPRPRAILSVSAHWETRAPRVSAVAAPETIHDFRGFPRALYEMRYPAPGAPELAARVADLLSGQGIPCGIDPTRGLDHGTWVPLKLMLPDADIPVTQLSIVPGAGGQFHLDMGRALASLADEGVLVFGSGSITHPLGELSFPPPTTTPAWASEFADAVASALKEARIDDLAAFERLPHYARNHPTDDHYLPLLVALGAGGLPARPLHRSYAFGLLGMDVYAFGAEAKAIAAA
jgi:4,5-DOPA dioxygenase extradiol